MTTNTKAVTVIGLGAMGITLATLLLKAGYKVTVWNRSAEKAAALVAAGAILATDAAAAVAASPVTVICVYNHAATFNILDTAAVRSVLQGRTLLQLTTISPAESRLSAAWAADNGAAYMNGAIQAAPAQMGSADTPILVSGPEVVYGAVTPLLQVFGGSITYLGDAVAAAPTMDLATLSYIYGSAIGFFHGVRISESEGFGANKYAEIIGGITPSYGEFLKHEGNMIHTGNFNVTQSPMRISIEATARLEQTAVESGINSAFPAFASALFKKAAAAGYEEEEVAALIKVLRNPAGI
jgi:3-hydroxyisobutyrate dehydrogenase-like beta-hydroxyacid dehydrogenase